MENQNQNTKPQNENWRNLWSPEEEKKLSQALTFCWINATEKFGNELDLSMRVSGFKFVLGADFTIDEILSAFQIFMKKSSRMIAPADVQAILSPEKPKITQAEFIHAKEQWRLEGYPSHSFYAGIVKGYESEQSDSRTPEPKAQVPLGQLVSRVKKQIETPEKPEENLKTWDEMDNAEKDFVLSCARGLPPSSREIYLKSVGAPEV